MNNNENKCHVCGAIINDLCNDLYLDYYDCPTCGKVVFQKQRTSSNKDYPNDHNKLASYLYYNGILGKTNNGNCVSSFIGDIKLFEEIKVQVPLCNHITKTIVNNWYPKTFSEKVDMFLLGLASRSSFHGEPIEFTKEQLISACFIIREIQTPTRTESNIIDNQITYFVEYLEKQQYIDTYGKTIVLLPKGIERIDYLQKNISSSSKNVFVAMSFAQEMSGVREAIKESILNAGFIPRIMDEIEHNHQIVPEMLYEIRKSRFVIAELTGHNNGAYFEAGYALGYGKEVIHICKASEFEKDGHFDVKQVNTILWNTTEELKNKLLYRIKATII